MHCLFRNVSTLHENQYKSDEIKKKKEKLNVNTNVNQLAFHHGARLPFNILVQVVHNCQTNI